MQYSLKKGLLKALKALIIFGLPVIIDRFVVSYPEAAQLTLGAALYWVANWFKVAVGLRLP